MATMSDRDRYRRDRSRPRSPHSRRSRSRDRDQRERERGSHDRDRHERRKDGEHDDRRARQDDRSADRVRSGDAGRARDNHPGPGESRGRREDAGGSRRPRRREEEDDDRRGGKEHWGKAGDGEEEEPKGPAVPKEEPNLGLSGKLAAETNKVNGVVLKHVPPAEARKPDKRWRLYIFKNDQLQEEPYMVHRSDHYLFGRDVTVADIITAHPSCSKQHAVLQYRQTEKPDEYGLAMQAVRPYLLDLGSVNGTFLNNERIEAERYYELLEKDVIRFGQSTREYVLLHETSNAD